MERGTAWSSRDTYRRGCPSFPHPSRDRYSTCLSQLLSIMEEKKNGHRLNTAHQRLNVLHIRDTVLQNQQQRTRLYLPCQLPAASSLLPHTLHRNFLGDHKVSLSVLCSTGTLLDSLRLNEECVNLSITYRSPKSGTDNSEMKADMD